MMAPTRRTRSRRPTTTRSILGVVARNRSRPSGKQRVQRKRVILESSSDEESSVSGVDEDSTNDSIGAQPPVPAEVVVDVGKERKLTKDDNTLSIDLSSAASTCQSLTNDESTTVGVNGDIDKVNVKGDESLNLDYSSESESASSEEKEWEDNDSNADQDSNATGANRDDVADVCDDDDFICDDDEILSESSSMSSEADEEYDPNEDGDDDDEVVLELDDDEDLPWDRREARKTRGRRRNLQHVIGDDDDRDETSSTRDSTEVPNTTADGNNGIGFELDDEETRQWDDVNVNETLEDDKQDGNDSNQSTEGERTQVFEGEENDDWELTDEESVPWSAYHKVENKGASVRGHGTTKRTTKSISPGCTSLSNDRVDEADEETESDSGSDFDESYFSESRETHSASVGSASGKSTHRVSEEPKIESVLPQSDLDSVTSFADDGVVVAEIIEETTFVGNDVEVVIATVLEEEEPSQQGKSRPDPTAQEQQLLLSSLCDGTLDGRCEATTQTTAGVVAYERSRDPPQPASLDNIATLQREKGARVAAADLNSDPTKAQMDATEAKPRSYEGKGFAGKTLQEDQEHRREEVEKRPYRTTTNPTKVERLEAHSSIGLDGSVVKTMMVQGKSFERKNDGPELYGNKENNEPNVTEKRDNVKFDHGMSIKRGKWSLGAKIGSGSFGIVHVGMNLMTGQFMAVKSMVMDPSIVSDIRREVDTLQSLSHQHIVRYLGAERCKGKLHIFQEWVPGGSVSSLLRKFGPFATPVIQSYLHQILKGLSYLHENKILHRDLKGSNILVNDSGVVKLADFGAAKRLLHQHADMMETLTMKGTPFFMAPEVFGEKYGSKADVWSAGCVAFQMATANAPWKLQKISNPVALCRHLDKSEGPPPLDWAATSFHRQLERDAFKSILEKCFARVSSHRPTASHLLTEPFFEMPSPVDDESTVASRGLFSPGSTSKFGSPRLSVESGSTRSSFSPTSKESILSPPLPRRIGPSFERETMMSPLAASPRANAERVDSSDWPTWAKAGEVAREPSPLLRQTKKPPLSPSLKLTSPQVRRSIETFADDSLKYSVGSNSTLDGLNLLLDAT